MKAKSSRSKRRSSPYNVLPTLALISILCLTSYISQIILHPIYGSIGTSLHHSNVVFTISTITCLLTFLGYGSHIPLRKWKPIALILICGPVILPNLFEFSGKWGPIWGPILTQAVMTWPCVFFASHDVSGLVVERIGKQEIRRYFSLPLFLALSIAVPITVVLNISEQKLLVSYLQPFVGTLWSRFSILLFLGILALLVDTIPTIKQRDYVTLITIISTLIPIILLVLNRPHVITGINPALLSRLPKEYTYLARQESITGIITVVENSKAGYRVLKCDHSLLGGLWVGIKRKELFEKGIVGREIDGRSVNEAESVYTTFLVQEAIRLIKRPSKKKDSALIMYFPLSVVIDEVA